ncbi:MAG: hypothetical protein HYR56_22440 [Acidobacteria bacterium]|nr:hypothetical protein [Acidobacteriota bacterium]MBI3424480.1 hypothetical protein [Acidobacteriota bacterium]
MALQAEVTEEIRTIADQGKRGKMVVYWDGVLRFIEWVMRLPSDLEIKFEDEFNVQYGEAAMEFMSYREQIGFDKGEITGEIKLLLKVLSARFGEPPHQVKEAVARIDSPTVLERLAEIAATCVSVDEFERALPN